MGKAVEQAHPHPFQRVCCRYQACPDLGSRAVVRDGGKGLALGGWGHRALVTDSLMLEAQ